MKKSSAAPIVASVKRMLRRHRDEWGPDRRETLERQIAYFETNAERTRYGHFQAQGYFIGSGVVEGACRHVVRDRMEQTGMRWTTLGAQSMLHLRAIYLNGDWHEYLEYHIQTEQAALYAQKAA